MTEPEPTTPPEGEWAPPTGPPAPRPDPYAQFGNPLHDTWGTSQHQTPDGHRPTRVLRSRPDRPAVRWALTAALVGLVALGAWVARDAIGDGWDWVYDRASEFSGDDAGGGDTPGSGAPVTSTTPVGDEAFDEWVDSNSDALDAAVERIEATESAMATLSTEADSADPTGAAPRRAAIVEFRDATLGAVQALRGAPAAGIRDDFITVLLLQVDEANQLIAASDAGNAAAVRAAALRLERAQSEAQRLCRQHGGRAGSVCS